MTKSIFSQVLFTFDLKPIASQIASKLIEYDDKTITKSFNNLNSNELELICTSNVGSHFVQHCLKEFSTKDKIEWLQSFLDKLKVLFLDKFLDKFFLFLVQTIRNILF
jgi:hypothetical protein